MRPLRTALVLGLAFTLCALSACRSAPDRRLLQELNQDGFGKRYVGNAEEENYVTLGDTVLWQDKFNKTQDSSPIAIDGTILVSEVGAVSVAGLTRTEIEALLTQKLAPYYQRTDISVRITAKAKQYYIFGEVAGPGSKPFPGDLTIFDAVMTNNPKEHSANLGRVKLIRADPQDPTIIVVNVADLLRSGDSTFNVHVKEGDIIVVPPTMMAQLAYFISDIIFPFTEVFQTIFQGLFSISNFNNFQNNQLYGF